jgi:alkylation response protein AidB-like acyl-CoA dehydrogenase
MNWRAKKYSQERKAFGERNFQTPIAFKLADMATQQMQSVLRLRLKKDAGKIFNQVQWQNYLLRKLQWIQQLKPVYGGNGYVLNIM